MSHWIRRFAPSPDAALRLVCLPYAGGAASAYFAMAKALAPDVEVLAIQYPGRQDRSTEPVLTSVLELADGVVQALDDDLDRPVAVFGHSMGALVAYESVKRLEAAGVSPRMLFASGCGAPQRERRETVHTGSDEDVLADVRYLAGTELQLLDDDDFKLFLPMIRGDYQAVETYAWAQHPPLSTPIRVLIGENDPKVSLDDASAWRDHSGDFAVQPYPGGHFFLNSRQEQVTSYLAGMLDARISVNRSSR
jgi:surfactin synthase thioesterase subunit